MLIVKCSHAHFSTPTWLPCTTSFTLYEHITPHSYFCLYLALVSIVKHSYFHS